MDSSTVPRPSSGRSVTTQDVLADDDVLFWYADRLAEEDGVPIDYAYRIAQLRFSELHAVLKEEAMDTPFYRHNARFELGLVTITPGALVAVIFNGVTPASLLYRHVQGDWGDLDSEDKAQNDWALAHGARILSAYTLADSTRIWIITEADRSVSTLLLPEEY